ncbi:hypothetical protein Tco_0720831 [Tanacetum coccineum]
MMSFLTAVVTSRYPTTKNQLRTSSNPRQQATIYDGKVTVQPVQGRKGKGMKRGSMIKCCWFKLKLSLPTMLLIKPMIWMPMTLIVMNLTQPKIALMANLSRNGSDALTEVHNPDNLNYDLFNQSEQIMTFSEQSNDVSQTETDIISDSNIIPYS